MATISSSANALLPVPIARALAFFILVAILSLSSRAQTPNAPIGNSDGVQLAGSTYQTWGWTCDPDSWATSLAVHFYIDGTYATGTFAGAVTANTIRNDVFNVCGGTTTHGYDFFVPNQNGWLTPGTTHTIYAYAIDNGGVGPNPLLGAPLSYTVSASSTFTISGKTGTPGATVTIGGRTATADAVGAYSLGGFAAGTYQVSATGQISGDNCSIAPASLTVTVGPDQPAADFTTQCERSWNQRFSLDTSYYRECDPNIAAPYDCVLSNGSRPAWAFSNSNEVPLDTAHATWPVHSLPFAHVPDYLTQSIQPAARKVVLSIDKDNDLYTDADYNIALTVKSQDKPAWMTDSTVWFSQTYSTNFIEDNFDVNRSYPPLVNTALAGDYPRLGEDLWIDLGAVVTSHRISIDGPWYATQDHVTPISGFPAVNGMSRLTVGITAEWAGQTRFLEIVLWQDDAYDSCKNSYTTTWWGTTGKIPCDTTDSSSGGIYQRRASWGTGENVYFYGPQLGQVYQQISGLSELSVPPTLSVGQRGSYSLPITKLFQWYFGGGRSDLGAPADWSQAIVRGVYLGIEMWGKAQTTVEIDNYRLYAVRR
jgi:hypothetical protein